MQCILLRREDIKKNGFINQFVLIIVQMSVKSIFFFILLT